MKQTLSAKICSANTPNLKQNTASSIEFILFQGVDESLDKVEGHIRGLKYKVDELSTALNEKKAIDIVPPKAAVENHQNVCSSGEIGDRFEGLETLLEGQSLLLNQLVEENKKLGSEMHCIAEKNNANGKTKALCFLLLVVQHNRV